MALLSLSSDASIVYYFKKRLTEKYYVPLTINLSGTHTRKSKEKSFGNDVAVGPLVILTALRAGKHVQTEGKRTCSIC